MKTALVTVQMATVDLTVKVSMLCGGSLQETIWSSTDM